MELLQHEMLPITTKQRQPMFLEQLRLGECSRSKNVVERGRH